MEDVGGVHVLETAEDLVDEVLAVVVGEGLRGGDDLVQVGVHQFGDDIYIFVVARRGEQHVFQRYNLHIFCEIIGKFMRREG